jgi:hypothetical protein
MKKYIIIVLFLIGMSNIGFSNVSMGLKENINLAFNNISDELALLTKGQEDSRLYHDETVIYFAPELGVKVPAVTGLSFTLSVEYTFKRKLPEGYVYDKP